MKKTIGKRRYNMSCCVGSRSLGISCTATKLLRFQKTFRNIPGVLEVRVGEVIESDRAIVDDSFDVAILVVVPDGKYLKDYLDHPLHQTTKTQVLLPLVEKVVVYDFQE